MAYRTSNLRGFETSPGELSAPMTEELNCFFARFELHQQHSSATAPPPPGSCNTPFTVKEHEVFLTVNTRKASGPEGVHGRVLRECTYQLAPIFTRIFNQSLAQAVIPPCLKSTSVIPVPKRSTVILNDYRPVALTPVIMKCVETVPAAHQRPHSTGLRPSPVCMSWK